MQGRPGNEARQSRLEGLSRHHIRTYTYHGEEYGGYEKFATYYEVIFIKEESVRSVFHFMTRYFFLFFCRKLGIFRSTRLLASLDKCE